MDMARDSECTLSTTTAHSDEPANIILNPAVFAEREHGLRIPPLVVDVFVGKNDPSHVGSFGHPGRGRLAKVNARRRPSGESPDRKRCGWRAGEPSWPGARIGLRAGVALPVRAPDGVGLVPPGDLPDVPHSGERLL
jgi:hypothetical protein